MAAAPGRLFDALAFHASFRADATACVDLATGERLSYRTLQDRAYAAAAAIAERVETTAGQRIAVISRNTAMAVILSAACELSGAIFVPLNWRLSPAELTIQIRDCVPALIICEAEFADAAREAAAIAGLSTPIIPPESVAGPDLPAPADAPSCAPAAMTDPCIMLYTSGTTGQPKGVVITRENALFSSLNFAAVACVTPSSILLCDAPMFHTVGLVAIVRTALLQGACVFLSDRFIPSATLTRLSDPALAVTHYFVVPQMVEALLREPGAKEADFSRLTALFSGGGPLSAELIGQCAARGVKLVNGYGMSEIGSAAHMPLDANYIAANPGAVGFAAPYIDLQLTGADGHPVADGDVGEIWARGPAVSPGYWRQDEATAASRSGDWFRTGDLARRQADGAMLIVGRLKDMYITGGENVFPAEVETTLRALPGVVDAAVVGVPDKRWGECGVAFIETAPGGAPSEEAIRAHCSANLARYKSPARIVFLDALPRTGSGKILKAQLRADFLKNAGAA